MISQARPEHFLISWDLIKACGPEEIIATYNDMLELGIAKMPYPLTDVSIPVGIRSSEIKNSYDPDTVSLIMGVPGGGDSFDCYGTFSYENEICVRAYIKTPDKSKNDWIIANENGILNHSGDFSIRWIRMALIVLLATKGIVKAKTKDKLAALGIGKNKATRAIYTTTLSLPIQFQSQSINEHNPTGTTLRAHLRRGHIRNQRHGPKLEFIKKIWVEPCFVNSDEEYVSQRFSYNVSQREARP